MNIQKIEIVVKGVHRTIGYIDYDQSTYFTKRSEKNLFKSYYGFGISVPVIDYLIDHDVKNIVIVWAGKSFRINTIKFYINGFDHDDGIDHQIIMPLSYFDNVPFQFYLIEEAKEKQMFVGRYSFTPKYDIKESSHNPQLNLGSYL